MRLYEISNNLRMVLDMEDLDNDPGALETALDALNLSLEEKVINTGKFIIEKEHKIQSIKNEINRMKTKLKNEQKKVEWLKNYTRKNLEKVNIKKIDGDTLTVSVANCPPACEIEDEVAIPSKYIITKQEHVVDKKRILEDLKAGEGIPGCKLIQRKTLRIK